MALTMQANVAMVATLSSARLITTMLTVPFLARRISASDRVAGPAAGAAEGGPDFLLALSTTDNLARNGDASPTPAAKPGATPGLPWAACLAIGVGGGCLFSWLQLPAAGVMGSILAVAGARISGIPLNRPPDRLRTGAQLGIGILIGTTFNPQTASQLAQNLLPVIGAAAALVASGLVLSRTLQRVLGLDARTALLACSPAGLTQMAALSEEMGAQTFIVSIFQLTRMLTVVLILPIIFRLLLPQ
jgi:membrane AbrB-like protein